MERMNPPWKIAKKFYRKRIAAIHEVDMDSKGRVFKGILAGKSYDMLAPFFGMGDGFFKRAIGGIAAESGMRVLDLGCGTGKLLFALCERSHTKARFYGCDYSADQLKFAEERKPRFAQEITFIHASMDELDFPDAHFDIVMSSMALHAVNSGIRQKAIREAARMLKNDGLFLLIESGRPCFGLISLMFSALGGLHKKDAYDHELVDGYCRESGLELMEENYLNSLIRRQLFMKKAAN